MNADNKKQIIILAVILIIGAVVVAINFKKTPGGAAPAAPTGDVSADQTGAAAKSQFEKTDFDLDDRWRKSRKWILTITP